MPSRSLSFGCKAIDFLGWFGSAGDEKPDAEDCGMDEEGFRSLEGVVGIDAVEGIEVLVDGAGRLFLIFFFAGKEGSGAVGGPPFGDGGNEGRGKVEVAMIRFSDLDF